MFISSGKHSSLRHVGFWMVGVVTAALVMALLAPLAQAEPLVPGDPSCPEVFPVSELTKGQQVTGLTVTAGTEPELFSGTFIGSSQITSGPPMPLFKFSGSQITTPDGKLDRGIWAGMSGSPVYAEDGRLIGAVSYGLGDSPSEYGGVTPAAAMYDLGRYNQAMEPVEIDPSLAKALLSSGASPTQVAQDLRPLATTFSLSSPLRPRRGAKQEDKDLKRVEKLANRVGLNHVKLRSGADSGGVGLPIDESAIVPGGNLGMMVSIGNQQIASVGTVTAVCDGQVIGFGHPMEHSGATNAFLAGAHSLYIQDGLLESFKVASFGQPLGTITQDRLAGVLGRLGPIPPAARVNAKTAARHNNRDETSWVSAQEWLPLVIAEQLATETILAADGRTNGTLSLQWNTTIKRANSSEQTLRRNNMFANNEDVLEDAVWQIADEFFALANNRHEEIEITDVEFTNKLDKAFHAYHIANVKVKQKKRWVNLSKVVRLRRHPGQKIRLRIFLEPQGRSKAAPITLKRVISLPVEKTRDTEGELLITGGASRWSLWYEGEFADTDELYSPELGEGVPIARNFDELLALGSKAVPNNSVVTELLLEPSLGGAWDAPPAVIHQARRVTPSVVEGERVADVRIKRLTKQEVKRRAKAKKRARKAKRRAKRARLKAQRAKKQARQARKKITASATPLQGAELILQTQRAAALEVRAVRAQQRARKARQKAKRAVKQFQRARQPY